MDERTGEVSRDKDDPTYTNSDWRAGEANYYDIEGLPRDPAEQGNNDSLVYPVSATSDLNATAVDYTESDDNTDDQTQAIRADIEQTRASLSDTINEIQERLNPQTIVEQAKDSALELIEHAKDSAKDTAEEAIDHAKQAVHDATIGKVEHMVSNVSDTVQETGSGLMGLIKSNPVPAALAGLGLGWLYMKRNEIKPAQSSSTYRQYRPSTSSSTNYGSYSSPASFSGSYPAGSYGNARMSSPGLPGQLIDSVKQNPVPAALAGLSIGYMMMQGQGQQRAGSGYQSYSYPVGNAAQSARQGSESLTNKVGNVAGGVGDKVGDIASSAGDVVGNVASTAGDVVGNVTSTAGDVVGNVASGVGTVAGGAVGAVGTVAGGVGDVVGNVASGAGDVVGNVAEGVGYQAERVTNGLERLFNDKPLVVGAMAVGVGAFIGLMLPETQQEKQLLGEARDQLVGKVQDVASQTMEKVGQVADEVQNTVKREAEDKGLIQS